MMDGFMQSMLRRNLSAPRMEGCVRSVRSRGLWSMAHLHACKHAPLLWLQAQGANDERLLENPYLTISSMLSMDDAE